MRLSKVKPTTSPYCELELNVTGLNVSACFSSDQDGGCSYLWDFSSLEQQTAVSTILVLRKPVNTVA
ncbi:hypothetical protein O9929_24245 [Vibrio lentus]|nr:hypothetical protein [Vibrio lentus]